MRHLWGEATLESDHLWFDSTDQILVRPGRVTTVEDRLVRPLPWVYSVPGQWLTRRQVIYGQMLGSFWGTWKANRDRHALD